MNEHIKLLLGEYLAWIEWAQNPHLDADDRRYVAAQRSLTHDELIRLLGPDYERPFDMQAWARRVTQE